MIDNLGRGCEALTQAVLWQILRPFGGLGKFGNSEDYERRFKEASGGFSVGRE